MRRRVLFLAALALSAAIACADSTAPDRPMKPNAARAADWACRSGYETPTGFTCTDSTQI